MKRIVSAIKSGFKDKALSILKDFDSNLSNSNYSKLITLSLKFDAAIIFEWLITSSLHRFNLKYVNWQKKFFNACNVGSFEIVQKMLLLNLVDPSMDENMALSRLSRSKHLNIGELLLNDKRVIHPFQGTMQLNLLVIVGIYILQNS